MRILVDYRPALRARTGVGEYIRQLVQAYTATHHDDLALLTSSWKDRPAPTLGAELRALASSIGRVPVSVLNYLWHRPSGRRSRRWRAESTSCMPRIRC